MSKINLGCGNKMMEDFLNVDVAPECEPDIIVVFFTNCISYNVDFMIWDFNLLCKIHNKNPKLRLKR